MCNFNNRRSTTNQQRTGLAVARLDVTEAMPNSMVDKMNWPETKANRPATKHEPVNTSRYKVEVFILNLLIRRIDKFEHGLTVTPRIIIDNHA